MEYLRPWQVSPSVRGIIFTLPISLVGKYMDVFVVCIVGVHVRMRVWKEGQRHRLPMRVGYCARKRLADHASIVAGGHSAANKSHHVWEVLHAGNLANFMQALCAVQALCTVQALSEMQAFTQSSHPHLQQFLCCSEMSILR